MNQNERVQRAIAAQRERPAMPATINRTPFRDGAPVLQTDIQASGILVVPGLTSIAAGGTIIGARLEIPNSGRLIAWCGGAVGVATADLVASGLSSLGVKMNANGQSDFITTGAGADYGMFGVLFPKGWEPINVPVDQKDVFIFDFKNFGAAAFTPALHFKFEFNKR